MSIRKNFYFSEEQEKRFNPDGYNVGVNVGAAYVVAYLQEFEKALKRV